MTLCAICTGLAIVFLIGLSCAELSKHIAMDIYIGKGTTQLAFILQCPNTKPLQLLQFAGWLEEYKLQAAKSK